MLIMMKNHEKDKDQRNKSKTSRKTSRKERQDRLKRRRNNRKQWRKRKNHETQSKTDNNDKIGRPNYKINGRKPGAQAYSKGRKYAR